MIGAGGTAVGGPATGVPASEATGEDGQAGYRPVPSSSAGKGGPDAVLRNEFAVVELRVLRDSGRNVLRVRDVESGAVADFDPFLLSRLTLTLADGGQEAVELVAEVVRRGIPGNGGERRRVGRFTRNRRALQTKGEPRQKGEGIGDRT